MQRHNTTKRTKKQAERAQVFCNGRMIGGIVDDTLRKHVDASKHFLRQPPAIAFDLDVLAQAKSEGVRFVEVIDRESGKIFRTTIARIWQRGFHVDRGHGAQIGLALDQWNRDGDTIADQPTLF